MSPITPAPKAVKPGYRTTEFWLTVAASVLPALKHALEGQTDPLLLKIAACINVAYFITRSVAKA